MKRTLFSVAAAGLVTMVVSAGAIAAPVKAPKATPITIYCPSGTFAAVVNGNGNFTAAHAVDSNTVLIPIAFGPFTATLDGVVLGVDPAVTKGSSAPRNGRLETCNYTVEFDTPNGHFLGFGSVTGFISHA